MASTSPDLRRRLTKVPPAPTTGVTITKMAIYFDGATNRRRGVVLVLGAELEICENGTRWRHGATTICAAPTAG